MLPGYQTTSIRVFFVYAIDFKHQKCHIKLSNYWRDPVLRLFAAMFLVSVTLLYILRCLVRLRSATFLHGLLELIATVVGGGNIHIQHPLERAFFAIVMIASVLLVPIYLADFSMHSVLIESEKINTFEKLAEQNVCIRVSSILYSGRLYIADLLE